jgi:hypothetical protein
MLGTDQIDALLGQLDGHGERIVLTEKGRTITAWYNSPLGYLCLAEGADEEPLTAARLADYLRAGAVAPVIHGRDGLARVAVTAATAATHRNFGQVLTLSGCPMNLR